MSELGYEGTIEAYEVLDAISDGVKGSMPEFDYRQMIDAVSDGVSSFLSDELNGKLVVDAFSEGTKNAIWQMITNATDTPCQDFYDAVTKGIKEAILEMDLADVLRKSV